MITILYILLGGTLSRTLNDNFGALWFWIDERTETPSNNLTILDGNGS